MARLPDERAIAEIRDLVQRDKLKEALERLSDFDDFQLDASQLTWRYNRVRSQELKNTITMGDANAEYANIVASILEIVCNQPPSPPDAWPGPEPA